VTSVASGPERAVEKFCASMTNGRADDAIACLDRDATWWVGGGVEGLSGTRRGDAVPALIRSVLALCVDGRLVIEPRASVPCGYVVGGRCGVQSRGGLGGECSGSQVDGSDGSVRPRLTTR
jgi:limonene-1,2-epoxide hydrolase